MYRRSAANREILKNDDDLKKNFYKNASEELRDNNLTFNNFLTKLNEDYEIVGGLDIPNLDDKFDSFSSVVDESTKIFFNSMIKPQYCGVNLVEINGAHYPNFFERPVNTVTEKSLELLVGSVIMVVMIINNMPNIPKSVRNILAGTSYVISKLQIIYEDRLIQNDLLAEIMVTNWDMVISLVALYYLLNHQNKYYSKYEEHVRVKCVAYLGKFALLFEQYNELVV